MSLDLFIPFLIATVILLATPGPTILLVVSYALAQGRGVALAVVGGVILGDLLAMSATLLGLGVVMTASASLFTVMIATFVGLGGRMLSPTRFWRQRCAARLQGRTGWHGFSAAAAWCLSGLPSSPQHCGGHEA